ncbi:MAG: M48 family metallopeptidase [Acidobacteriia bacterium]|nr:M48 family metallopeptidase [Terriglobia bacterium]
MNTEKHRITVNGLSVEVVHKTIKNLHLGVYPPRGRVRVAVPMQVSDNAVRLAVVGKLGWIKRQRARFETQPRQSRREMVSGESHYFLGQRYRLRVVSHDGPPEVLVRNKSTIELHVRRGTNARHREMVLQRWYRRQLKELIPALLEKWQTILGVEVAAWGIKRMKTKWGSCNMNAGRIWVNLELAKKPVQCLEYIVVHELVHLIERHHSDRFISIMDHHLPQWRLHRDELNRLPLGHATWEY